MSHRRLHQHLIVAIAAESEKYPPFTGLPAGEVRNLALAALGVVVPELKRKDEEIAQLKKDFDDMVEFTHRVTKTLVTSQENSSIDKSLQSPGNSGKQSQKF